MKKIMFLATIMASVLSTYGQYEFTDSNRHVDLAAYAGVLTGGRFSVQSAKLSGTTNLRVGGAVNFAPTRWFSSYVLGAFDVDETLTVTPLYLVGATFKPVERLSITVGKIASPMTELRPLPTTMPGQFEPWTKSRILGSAIGGKVRYAFTDKVSLVTGGFLRGTDGTVELGLAVPHLQLAGYYAVKGKTFGAAATASSKYFSETLSYNHRKDAASLTVLTIPKGRELALYSDVGVDASKWVFTRGEWGILDKFSYKFIKVLTAVGYSQEIRSVKVYVMVAL